MKITSSRLSQPIDAAKARVLVEIVDLCRGEPSQPMLVGAFARDLWLWNVHGIDTIRATQDVDISMEFPDWAGYGRFASKLTSKGFDVLNPKHPEKLTHKATRVEVDLLPFGGLSEDGANILWPTDGSRWGISGFAESYGKAAWLELEEEGRGMRVAPLAAIVMLKVIAVSERAAARRKKDSDDIGLILERYLAAGNKGRLMSTGPEDWIMGAVNGDSLRASATLVGVDIGRIANANTRTLLAGILEHETTSSSRCPLAQELTSRLARGNFLSARILLKDLKTGIERASPS